MYKYPVGGTHRIKNCCLKTDICILFYFIVSQISFLIDKHATLRCTNCATHRGEKVDYLELSPWDLNVDEAGLVESMTFDSTDCLPALKEAKFCVPDFSIKSPWSDAGAAFSKLHVADTKLANFFKKGEGPKTLEAPDKGFFR